MGIACCDSGCGAPPGGIQKGPTPRHATPHTHHGHTARARWSVPRCVTLSRADGGGTRLESVNQGAQCNLLFTAESIINQTTTPAPRSNETLNPTDKPVEQKPVEGLTSADAMQAVASFCASKHGGSVMHCARTGKELYAEPTQAMADLLGVFGIVVELEATTDTEAALRAAAEAHGVAPDALDTVL
jgi:hypothetical protein